MMAVAAMMARRRRGRGSMVVMAAALAVLGAIRLVGGQALDNAVAREHAAVDAEVATHHEGAHGRVLTRQVVRLVSQVRLVLTPVNQHVACVPRGFPVAFVGGSTPAPSLTETCEEQKRILALATKS